LGSPLPPRRSGALGVFRHPLVVRSLAKPNDHFLELGLFFRDPTGNCRPRPSSCETGVGGLLPWTSLPVQRSRRMESDSRLNVPGSAPSPRGVSHALRGLILNSPCHHLQMADTLRVLPFRAFFLPDPRASSSLAVPSSMFLRGECPCWLPGMASPEAASPRVFVVREAVPPCSIR